eukprot:GEMP01011260.1.p1 GENE.GEMP01011260.1~~GEMP01011260.1.p1  ORF type:complete len:953 (+),score=201.06 GEMP01011260.1:139-2997(+)
MERFLVPPRPTDALTACQQQQQPVVSEYYLHTTSPDEEALDPHPTSRYLNSIGALPSLDSPSVFQKSDKLSRLFVLKLLPCAMAQLQESLIALQNAGVEPRDVKQMENGILLLLQGAGRISDIPIPLRPFGDDTFPAFDMLRCIDHFPHYFEVSRRILVVSRKCNLAEFQATLVAYGFTVLKVVTGAVVAPLSLFAPPAKAIPPGEVLLVVQSISRGLTFDERKIACGMPLPSPSQIYTKATDVPDKWKTWVPPERLETTCLVLFPHAKKEPHMVPFVRQLLRTNGFFILDERSRTLSQAEIALLLGLPPPKIPQVYPHCHTSACVLLDNYTCTPSWVFVLRRTNAIHMLLQLIYGHFEARRESSSVGPILPHWPFTQDKHLGGTKPIFNGLQAMATWGDSSPPRAPLVASCPFSRIHASFFLKTLNIVAHCGEVAIVGACPEVIGKLTKVLAALLYKRYAQKEVQSLVELSDSTGCCLCAAYRELQALGVEFVTDNIDIDKLCTAAFLMLKPGHDIFSQRLKRFFSDLWKTSSMATSVKHCSIAGGMRVSKVGDVQISVWNTDDNAYQAAVTATRALLCNELCGGFLAAACIMPRGCESTRKVSALVGLYEGADPLSFALQLFTDHVPTTVQVTALEARNLELSADQVVLRPTGNVEVGWRLVSEPSTLKSTGTNPLTLIFATDYRADNSQAKIAHRDVSHRLHSKVEAVVIGQQLHDLCEKVEALRPLAESLPLEKVLMNSLGVSVQLPMEEWTRHLAGRQKALNALIPTEGLILKTNQDIYQTWIKAVPDAYFRPFLDELLNSAEFVEFKKCQLRPCFDSLTSEKVFIGKISTKGDKKIAVWGCGLCLSLPKRAHAQAYVMLRCFSSLTEWEKFAPGVPHALLLGFERGVDAINRLYVGFQSICLLLELLDKPAARQCAREDLLRWLTVLLLETHNYWKELLALSQPSA